MSLHKYLSIITLNVNDLNASTKRHRVPEWLRKQDSYKWCLQETHLRQKDTHRLQVKGWKKILHANGKEKNVGIAVLISDKIDFETKAIIRNEEGRYIIIKGTVQQEE